MLLVYTSNVADIFDKGATQNSVNFVQKGNFSTLKDVHSRNVKRGMSFLAIRHGCCFEFTTIVNIGEYGASLDKLHIADL